MSETSSIVRPSIDAIRALGIPCERVHSGRVRVKRGYMQLADAGCPDIWTALGWLEAKLPGDKNTRKRTGIPQQQWRDRARAWGVRVEQTEGLEQTIAIVKRWLAEYEHERAMGWR